MFKKNDNVKCVKYSGDCNSSYMTIGKIYSVIRASNDETVLITNDRGEEWWVSEACLQRVGADGPCKCVSHMFGCNYRLITGPADLIAE